MKKRTIQNILFGLMFLIGFGILVYPTVSDQWNTYRQSRLITTYEQVIEEKQEETVTVDENLLDVTVTLPNSFFESFETTAEDYVDSMNEGNQKIFKEVKVNDDGSVSITMTKTQYNEFMGEMEKSIDDSLKEMIDGGDFAFVSISSGCFFRFLRFVRLLRSFSFCHSLFTISTWLNSMPIPSSLFSASSSLTS